MYLLRLNIIVLSFYVILATQETPEITFHEIENDGLGRSKFWYTRNDGTSNKQNINALNSDIEKDQVFSKGSYSYQKDGIVTIYNILHQKQQFPTNGIATLQGGGAG